MSDVHVPDHQPGSVVVPFEHPVAHDDAVPRPAAGRGRLSLPPLAVSPTHTLDATRSFAMRSESLHSILHRQSTRELPGAAVLEDSKSTPLPGNSLALGSPAGRHSSGHGTPGRRASQGTGARRLSSTNSKSRSGDFRRQNTQQTSRSGRSRRMTANWQDSMAPDYADDAASIDTTDLQDTRIQTSVRMRCRLKVAAFARRIVYHRYCTRFILAAILLNVVSMAIEDVPLTVSGGTSDRNQVCAVIDWVCLIIFTIEAALKIASDGLLLADRDFQTALAAAGARLDQTLPSPNTPKRVLTAERLAALEVNFRAQQSLYLASTSSAAADKSAARLHRPYLQQAWSRLDIIVVIIGWLNIALPDIGTKLGALRAFRALRTVRAFNFLSSMQVILQSLERSAGFLLNVLLCLGFMFLFFSIAGLQLFNGYLRQQCAQAVTVDGAVTWQVFSPTIYCSMTSPSACSDPTLVPLELRSNLTCIDAGVNPNDGTFSFDNFGSSVLTIFFVASLNGWSDIMYMMQDADTSSVWLFFVAAVVIINFFGINLFASVICNVFSEVREEQRLTDATHEQAVTVAGFVEEDRRRDSMFMSQMSMPAGAVLAAGQGKQDLSLTDLAMQDGPHNKVLRKHVHAGNRLKLNFFRRACSCITPQRMHQVRSVCRTIVRSPLFERLIILLIVANAVTLAMEQYNMPDDLESVIDKLDILFTVAFLLEMILKIVAMRGVRNYLKRPAHWFDALLVLVSLETFAEAILSSSSALGAFTTLRVFRLLRVFRIARLLHKLPTMKRLLDTVFHSLTAIGSLAGFIALYTICAALICMQLLARPYNPDGSAGSMNWYEDAMTYGTVAGSAPRINFDTFLNSWLAMFVLITGEQWTEILAFAWIQSWAGLIIVLIAFIFGNYVMLSMFTAVVVENFGVAEHDKQSLQMSRYTTLKKQYLLKSVQEQVAQLQTLDNQRAVAAAAMAKDPDARRRSLVSATYLRTRVESQLAYERTHNIGGLVQYMQEQLAVREREQAREELDRQASVDGEAAALGEPLVLRGLSAASSRALLSSMRAVAMGHTDSDSGVAEDNEEEDGSQSSLDEDIDTHNLSRVDEDEEGEEHATTEAPAETTATPAAEETDSPSPSGSPTQHAHGWAFQQAMSPISKRKRHVKRLKAKVLAGETSIVFLPALIGKNTERNLMALAADSRRGTPKSPLATLAETSRFGSWAADRLQDVQAMLSSKYFDGMMMIAIVASSVILATETPATRDDAWYWIADCVFFAIFALEALLKIAVFGVWKDRTQAYFRSPWNILDFFVLVTSGISLLMQGLQVDQSASSSSIRVLRLGRTLRPLRVLSKNESMKVVVESLLNGFGDIANVYMLSMFVYVIFAILGLSLFAGMLHRCSDPALTTMDACMRGNQTWGNPTYSDLPGIDGYSFDSFFPALQTIMEVIMLEGFLDVMFAAMDSTGVVDASPQFNATPANALYFIAVIVICTFFVTELYAGVIVESYRRTDGSAFMTEEQKQWADAKLTLRRKKPIRRFELSTNPIRKAVQEVMLPCNCNHDSCTWRWHRVHSNMEWVLMSMVILNTIVLMAWYSPAPEWWTDLLSLINNILLAAFVLEMALMNIALGPKQYWTAKMTIFDGLIVLGSGCLFVLDVAGVSVPAIGPIARLFRVGRFLRLARVLEQLQILLDTMALTVASLLNVTALLLLVLFTAAVVALDLFGDLPQRAGDVGISQAANFANFGNSMLLLFRLLTGENIQIIIRDCQAQVAGAPAFFFIFYSIGRYVFLNVYLAMILEIFVSVVRVTNPKAFNKRIEQFRELWSKFDTASTGFIPLVQVPQFLQELGPPLGGPTFGFEEWYTRVELDVILLQTPNGVPFDALLQLLPTLIIPSKALSAAERVRNELLQEYSKIMLATLKIQRAWLVYKRRGKRPGTGQPAVPSTPKSPPIGAAELVAFNARRFSITMQPEEDNHHTVTMAEMQQDE